MRRYILQLCPKQVAYFFFRGPYNARKVDVWSVGATLWELAEAEPPFSRFEDFQNIPDELPKLSQPNIFSRQFHDFLLMCSLPPDDRPTASELLQVRNDQICGQFFTGTKTFSL